MTPRSKIRNEYFKLKTNIERAKQTIFFLKKCKRNKVAPKFMKVFVNIQNSRTKKVCEEAKKLWLYLEINFIQSNITDWERRVYNLHLALIKDCKSATAHEIWMEEDRQMREVVEHKKVEARKTKQRKFKQWRSEQKPPRSEPSKCEPKFLEDFVVNLSSIQLNEDEMALLNKGLKHTLPPTKCPVEDICVDVMSSVRYKPADVKENIENNTFKILREVKTSHPTNDDNIRLQSAVKSLREKKLIISKADKSNNVVVMDVQYYERVMTKVISSGPYVELKSDMLYSMVDGVNEILEKHKHTICDDPKRELRKWKVTNPSVPCLYGLLKLHKDVDDEGDYKARPVACNTNAPSEALAKKLVAIFSSMTPPKGLTVKNGIEFAKFIHGTKVKRNEEMGSYDVTALYPSIPIDEAMISMRKWLISNELEPDKVDAYCDLTRVCMKQNIFQFRGKYYIQSDGTSIGNSLSGFVAEVFMCEFEVEMEKHPMFPRKYKRYVDDIFAVQNARRFDLVKKLF